MKVVLHDESKYMIRFDRGDEVVSGLKQFAVEKGIRAAVFSGIGATDEILVSWFHPDEKKYHDHHLTKKFEIVNLNGNITILNDEPIVHAHGSFSDVELHGRSGHVKKLIVSATCEIFLQTIEGEIIRGFDPDSGLHLMQ
ncbi:MAG: PPC domain-containing DNA-binding protein [Patescibacteria group bacterium]